MWNLHVCEGCDIIGFSGFVSGGIRQNGIEYVDAKTSSGPRDLPNADEDLTFRTSVDWRTKAHITNFTFPFWLQVQHP